MPVHLRCRAWVLRPGKSAFPHLSSSQSKVWGFILTRAQTQQKGHSLRSTCCSFVSSFWDTLLGCCSQGVHAPFSPLQVADANQCPHLTLLFLMERPSHYPVFNVHDSSVISSYNLGQWCVCVCVCVCVFLLPRPSASVTGSS